MELNAQKRKEFGKKNKSLRKEHKVPGVIYGKGIESIPVTIGEVAFAHVYATAGETNIVDLTVDNETTKVLVKNVQYHPIDNSTLHVDFYKVNLKEKVEANIPVDVINQEQNELIKSGEAIVLVLLNEIAISALPTDLPDAFVVDATKLQKIGDHVTIADLDYDKEKVEIIDNDPEDLVVKFDTAVQEEVEEEEMTEAEQLEKLKVTEESEELEESVEGVEGIDKKAKKETEAK